jgi:hypothetical protein
MEILWTKNQGSILLCERNLIQNVHVLLQKILTKENPFSLLHGD